MKNTYLSFLFITLLSFQFSWSQTKLESQLKDLFPDAKIEAIRNLANFKESYHIVLNQPLDHKNPEAGSFEHHMYLSHLDFSKPMLIVTEGYSARNRVYELSQLLETNQVIVEYRFYGKSRPNPIPWNYLTNDAAVEDYHEITTKLKQLYQKKWISTGISKGGETVMIYKSKYPKDVDVAVPYVAPLINKQEDPRTNDLINSVGEASCRAKIKEFQRAILNKRSDIMVYLRQHAAQKDRSFTEFSDQEALEHAVLEFPFSFWQWGGKCDQIPSKDAEALTLFNYLNQVSGFYLYSDAGVSYYLPSFYQHMTELGYYGYDLNPVKDLLKYVKTSSLKDFGPKGVDMTYNSNYIKKVRKYIEKKGNRILYIYGGFDPWGACAPEPKKNVDALKMVLKGGHHGTRIKDFSEKDQQLIMDTLKRWLN